MSGTCGLLKGGEKSACLAAKRLALTTQAFSIRDLKAGREEHPNKLPFTGTLLLLDQISDQPPNGAEGHKIYVPTSVAKKRLGTLVHMGLNYKADLDGHAPRHKVGIIEKAWIEGDKVKVKGVVWKRDFPEAVKDLKQGRLGMSMELSDVYVRDRTDDVWTLVDFHFSGATALYKKAAAYYKTALAAAGRSLGVSPGGKHMPKKAKKKIKVSASKKKAGEPTNGQVLAEAIAAGLGPTLEAVMAKTMRPVVSALRTQTRQTAALQASVTEMIEAAEEEKEEEELAAAEETDVLEEEDEDMGAEGEEDYDDEDDEMKAAEDEEEDEDTLEAADDDEEDEEMEAGMEDLEEDAADEEPGEFNKDAENQGDKKTVTAAKRRRMRARASRRRIRASRRSRGRGKVGTMSAASEKIGDLQATLRKERSMRKKLANSVEALQAQADHYADTVDRRTVTSDVQGLLEKSGYTIGDLRAAGQKLSVGEVDQMLTNTGVPLDVVTRMSIKNQLVAAGLMDEGAIQRYQN